jgi:hypothetical protein
VQNRAVLKRSECGARDDDVTEQLKSLSWSSVSLIRSTILRHQSSEAFESKN